MAHPSADNSRNRSDAGHPGDPSVPEQPAAASKHLGGGQIVRGAVVVAGGRGSRTGGRTKVLFADQCGQTLLGSVIAAVHQAGVDNSRIAVVGGPELAPELPPDVLLTREDPPFAGPAAAVAAGARALRRSERGCDEVFVLAADMPALAEALPMLAAALDSADTAAASDSSAPSVAPVGTRTDTAAEVALASTAGPDGLARTEFLLACARADSLWRLVDEREAAGDTFVNAPVKALWKHLRQISVPIGSRLAADVDSAADAQAWGVSARSRRPNWREAMRISQAAGAQLVQAEETVELAGAIGRVSAHSVTVPTDMPHYESSAMDGYAIRGTGPWTLLADRVDRHSREPGSLQPGQALPVVTGSAIPAGTDSIIRAEYAALDSPGSDPAAASAATQLRLAADAPRSELAGRHIRPIGREARAGDEVVPAGAVLTPAHIAFAAVCGIDELVVFRRPRVGFLYTGDEVRTSGTPEVGLVRDAFSPQLPAVARLLGCEVVAAQRIGDDRDVAERALRELRSSCDLVLSTGGTGHSDVDVVRAVAEQDAAGGRARMLFHELAMRPGHPTFAALYPGDDAAGTADGTGTRTGVANGTSSGIETEASESAGGDARDQTHAALHVALPGNPLAAMVAVRVVAQAAVCGMTGRDAEVTQNAVLGEAIAGGKTDRLVPAARSGDGNWTETSGTGANMLRGLAAADGLLVVPAGGAQAGQAVPLLDLPW